MRAKTSTPTRFFIGKRLCLDACRRLDGPNFETNTGVALAPYTALDFWIYGTSPGGQSLLAMMGLVNGSVALARPRALSAVPPVVVTSPVAVRYGWDSNPPCNLYNADALLPAAPFRIDSRPTP